MVELVGWSWRWVVARLRDVDLRRLERWRVLAWLRPFNRGRWLSTLDDYWKR